MTLDCKRNWTRENERGVALLTVLVSILIMSLLTIEFQYSVAIERKLAYSDLNQLQAHYLAKSGARFGLARIALFMKANKQFQSNNMIKQKLAAVWSLPLPPFPPAASTIKKLTKADKDAAEKAVQETMISTGQFSQTITNESSKINLNSLILTEQDISKGNFNINFASASPPNGFYEHVARLLYNAINEIFRASDNPQDEFGNYRVEEVVFDIMDWVNRDDVAFGERNKDRFYDQQVPPYKAKRGRFFTLDELRLVRSVEENLFQKLKPLVTVYSYEGKVNLNEANKNVLKAIYPDFTEDDLTKIMDEKNRIGEWSTEASFVDYVTKTLGRNGFLDRYKDPNDYPFTVQTYSFLIEGTGTVQKSKTTIQKKIRVAVALTTGKGTAATKNVSQADCGRDNIFFWKTNPGICLERPTDEDSCTSLTGVWKQDPNGVFGCDILIAGTQTQFITPPQGTAKKEPNALKVLYWMET